MKMHRRMYGYGGDMEKAIPLFRGGRIEAVTAPYDPLAARIATENGMAFYACTAAMEGNGPKDCCIDAWGAAVDSPCPNAPGLLAKNVQRIVSLATADHVKGVTLDYCRYPSPAAASACAGMTVCFCSACCAKMEQEGMDVEAMRRAVGKWPAWEETDLPLLRRFLRFRAKSVTAYVKALYDGVKAADREKELGAYVFAPSLAPLVGQSYASLAGCTDFLSPMLYRYYRHPVGIACLDHELGALQKMREELTELQQSKAARTLCALTGIDGIPSEKELKEKGLPMKMLWKELMEARRQTEGRVLIPIILLEDPRFLEVSDAVRIFDTDGVDFFLFAREYFEKLDVFQ